MKRLMVLFLVFLLLDLSKAAGAGRAFPIDSENFAIETFKRVNPSIEWDPTNFLVDLSGQYANCNYLHRKGEVQADRKTPEGAPVTIILDTTEGKDSDVNSVNGYVRKVIQNWANAGQYNRQITGAKRIGCSVRPACSGYTVIACVMSSGVGDNKPPAPLPPFRYTTRDPYAGKEQGDEDKNKKPEVIGGNPKALAFTPQQYDTAESIMGKKWDRAHFLENLSGFETDCSMIQSRDWPFNKAKALERELNLKIAGQYGTAANRGSTPNALQEILKNFKPVQNAKSIGCSVIPDCTGADGQMHVVVACLYEEF